MIRTGLMIYIISYSLLRLVAVLGYIYMSASSLPVETLWVTMAVCMLTLGVSSVTQVNRLSGKKLRLCLFIYALGAVLNMLICFFSVLGELSFIDLFVLGTFFDVILFSVFCFVKIRNTQRPFMLVNKEKR